ncbi:MAG: hypothetical protein OQL09_05030, partial [Gammaproteobacteria bacterium]|nr:hypothetical protein [Gammaproteobacteria bacterium]
MFLLSLAGVVNAATYIGDIRFVGNETTEESFLLQHMHINVGDEVNLKKIERSVQDIMDLGLYRNVSYYLQEEYQAKEPAEYSAELVIVVDEKYYLFVLPRIRVEDNQLQLGVQLRWDNLYGINHAMRLTAERKGENEGITEYRKRFRYKYPSILGSHFDMEFKIIDENNVGLNTDEVIQNQVEQSLGFKVRKWLNPEGRKYGKYVLLGMGYINREYEDITSRLVVDEAKAANLVAEYGYEKVHEHLYNRSGKHFGYMLDVSDDRFGSTSEYFKHSLFYTSYYRFKSRPNDNLNVQTIIGHSTDDVLGDRAFTLDYRNDLRGYDRDRFQGNNMLLINMEYLHTFGRYPTLRYLYFLDLGNTYDELKYMFHRPLNVGIGAGIRWKIPSLVRVD